MKKIYVLYLITCALLILASNLYAQVGYHDAPYLRYEADLGTLVNAASTSKSFAQADLQSEASEQVCVNLSNAGASVSWTVSADGDGLVVRYSVPDGESGILDVYADNVLAGTINLTSYYSWEFLATNGNPNNNGVSNLNPKMRFDEVRMKLPSKILAGGSLKLVRNSGNIHIDFAELEAVPASVSLSSGNVTYTGDGSTLQAFIDGNGGKIIYLPAGVYNVDRELYFGVSNTMLKGAGMWYTEIHFTNTKGGQGGLRANASNISYNGLYLTTVRNSRSSSYKAINGVYTSGSKIINVWAEHFECGAWIAQYNTGGPDYADGFTMSHCRFRNNYADGINLCKGTSNSIVEHCSFRNNGDDDMAIWSANGLECKNNTFRYNTSENCWRAAGCAVYGGLSNKAHNLLIQDNLEVGIKVNNSFIGAGFNDNGMHEFTDITIKRCGTFNDLFNNPVGAIDIASSDKAGTRVKNVKFSNINIIDSKNDAIYIYKKAGEGVYNLVFENITVDGTAKEYPGNNAKNLNWGRGYGILFVGYPSGNGTNCNMTYTNRGGNAATDVNVSQMGNFVWTPISDCITGSSTTITSSTAFGVCNTPITLTAAAVAPSGNTVNYVEFLVDNVNIGQNNTTPHSVLWNNATVGSHQIKAISHYTPSNTSSFSIQTVTVADGIYATAVTPVIDGIIDALWDDYAPFSLKKISVGSFSNTTDLTVTFKVTRDATNLYILADVTDDILRNDGTANWQKDAVEVFIDMGNDKSGAYVANNDYQYTFVYGVSTPQTGVTFAQTNKAGDLGYIMEIRIPWATLNGAPTTGALMGFDLHVNDNDTGTRNGKKAWTDGTDNAWQSTSVLGTLQIAGCTNPFPTGLPVFVGETNKFNFYPNPFHGSGNLQINASNAGTYSISIKDMSGRLISVENMEGNSSYSIGGSLSPGIYVVEVFDGSAKRAIKLIKL